MLSFVKTADFNKHMPLTGDIVITHDQGPEGYDWHTREIRLVESDRFTLDSYGKPNVYIFDGHEYVCDTGLVVLRPYYTQKLLTPDQSIRLMYPG